MEDPGLKQNEARAAAHIAEAAFDAFLARFKVQLEKGWLKFDVEGDIHISYPLFGSVESREKMVDKFAADLKQALRGERISTLN